LIERSGYERTGSADIYDRFRPSPPQELIRILTLVAQGGRLELARVSRLARRSGRLLEAVSDRQESLAQFVAVTIATVYEQSCFNSRARGHVASDGIHLDLPLALEAGHVHSPADARRKVRRG